MSRAITALFPIVFLWIVLGVAMGKLAGKDKKSPTRKGPVQEVPRQVRRPSNAGEGHVPTIGPNVRSKLEQLETLKKAGLLDQEEYLAKKQKILNSK